jgi:hypothetical protein
MTRLEGRHQIVGALHAIAPWGRRWASTWPRPSWRRPSPTRSPTIIRSACRR